MIASRWRWLLVPVPALALVFAYGLVLRPTYERQVVDLEQRLAAEVGQLRAAATAEPTVDLAARRREVAAAEEAASRRADALLAAWTKPAARAETVQELTRLLGACGAAVLRSNSESAETREGCVPPAARRLAGELAARGGATPSLWRLDLRCSWQQLGAALARIRELDTFALPVGLQITPAGTTDRFEVSLWTWI